VLEGKPQRQYNVTVYPSEEFFELYTTDNPAIAIGGAFVIVALTSLLFFGYDFAMRREVSTKQQMLQAKRSYMRYVSHEVRTPMNAVCMGVTLLQEEIKAFSSTCTSNKCTETFTGWLSLLDDVSISATSSVHVLNDLLHYDKIESGTATLELSTFPLLPLLMKTSSEFKLSAKTKKINFNVDTSSFEADLETCCDERHQHCVIGDPIRLTQVLRNLTSNAIKFTPEGGTNFGRIRHSSSKMVLRK